MHVFFFQRLNTFQGLSHHHPQHTVIQNALFLNCDVIECFDDGVEVVAGGLLSVQILLRGIRCFWFRKCHCLGSCMVASGSRDKRWRRRRFHQWNLWLSTEHTSCVTCILPTLWSATFYALKTCTGIVCSLDVGHSSYCILWWNTLKLRGGIWCFCMIYSCKEWRIKRQTQNTINEISIKMIRM